MVPREPEWAPSTTTSVSRDLSGGSTHGRCLDRLLFDTRLPRWLHCNDPGRRLSRDVQVRGVDDFRAEELVKILVTAHDRNIRCSYAAFDDTSLSLTLAAWGWSLVDFAPSVFYWKQPPVEIDACATRQAHGATSSQPRDAS